jgi:hypothetical protein
VEEVAEAGADDCSTGSLAVRDGSRRWRLPAGRPHRRTGEGREVTGRQPHGLVRRADGEAAGGHQDGVIAAKAGADQCSMRSRGRAGAAGPHGQPAQRRLLNPAMPARAAFCTSANPSTSAITARSDVLAAASAYPCRSSRL